MSDRIRVDDPSPVRALIAAAERDERMAPDAALEAAHHADQPRSRGVPILARAISGLQASAGNGAVASLLHGRGQTRHRAGSPAIHAAHAAIADRPVVQRGPDDEDKPADDTTDPKPTTDPNALAGVAGSPDAAGSTTDAAGTGGDTTGGGSTGAIPTGGGAPTPGPSWTKVGPPSNTTYTVSGSLRTAANAVAARTEAGSVTATPTQDTETFTPDGGTEKVTAARVTVAQVMELPSWSDKSSATTNQQAEWNRFFTAITTHENGHVALDKTAYAGVHSKMVGQAPGDASKKLDTAEAKAKTDNDTYDNGNDHGLKQGTGINPNIDEVTKVP